MREMKSFSVLFKLILVKALLIVLVVSDNTDVISTAKGDANCCTVVTPRVCEKKQDYWSCFSRRYKRCGPFCIAKVIMLTQGDQNVEQNAISNGGNGVPCASKRRCSHNCSGCFDVGSNTRNCSIYCFRNSSCPKRFCKSIELQEFLNDMNSPEIDFLVNY